MSGSMAAPRLCTAAAQPPDDFSETCVRFLEHDFFIAGGDAVVLIRRISITPSHTYVHL